MRKGARRLFPDGVATFPKMLVRVFPHEIPDNRVISG